MILPKGIVLNHDRIYNQVASYSHIPPEQVFEFWHGTTIMLARPTIKP